ncbi:MULTISPECIES: spore maturation protein [unclassified Candidatus Frackibacter]|uniref:spore maturation protein n=1 Tax=unclassified Candidatus Frackibacter TaxID=2648818 RepID=UPI00088E4E86|nr:MULTISPECIES: spore maturation protein [unclassified Candidatus Frackibacter]SDC51022.1 spore maturation protein B [Candidatus Frackibacter sp. WG11]SEM40647.1 spore maturation protein B [Candidatus Frackibacter sp. WG12]SFL75092.1 spore maturation protein B [Candidatus Frackibacter sp. WG13]
MALYLKYLSEWAIPVIVLTIVAYAYFKQVKVYEVFTEGAVEGVTTVVKIIPYLIAMLMAISIFRASGALDILLNILQPVLQFFGIPKEIVPLGLVRPLSGTGSLGIVTELIQQYGPDSFIGRLASTLQGSTETTFYIVAVYFGAVGIRNTRYAIVAGLIADLVGFLAAIYITRMVF